MLYDKLVKGFVFIDGLNDLITERPQVIDHKVTLKSVALPKPDYVKPMASPALTVTWRRKQTLHQLLHGRS